MGALEIMASISHGYGGGREEKGRRKIVMKDDAGDDNNEPFHYNPETLFGKCKYAERRVALVKESHTMTSCSSALWGSQTSRKHFSLDERPSLLCVSVGRGGSHTG